MQQVNLLSFLLGVVGVAVLGEGCVVFVDAYSGNGGDCGGADACTFKLYGDSGLSWISMA